MVYLIAFYIYLLLPMSSMLSYVSIEGLLKLNKKYIIEEPAQNAICVCSAKKWN